MHGWGEVDVAEIKRAILGAHELGVNFFDTADCYGLGQSETLLGEALGNRRNEVVIATKFGIRFDNHGKTCYDNSKVWLDQALDQSLGRLKTDYIDLYQVHYWDTKTTLADVFEHLDEKVREGKIRSYGITNIPIGVHLSKRPKHLASFSQELSLANRTDEDQIVAEANKFDLAFLSWGSLGQGILSGKYSSKNIPRYPDRRARPTYENFHGAKLERNIRLLKIMENVIQNYPGRSLPQLALRALLDRYPFCAVLTGIKSGEQLNENVGATGWQLRKTDIDKLFDREFLDS